jgi:hypothetical protein
MSAEAGLAAGVSALAAGAAAGADEDFEMPSAFDTGLVTPPIMIALLLIQEL